MSAESKTTYSFQVVSILTVLLAVGKVSGVVTIPWVWVFAPYWLPIAAVLAVLGALAALGLIAFLVVTLVCFGIDAFDRHKFRKTKAAKLGIKFPKF